MFETPHPLPIAAQTSFTLVPLPVALPTPAPASSAQVLAAAAAAVPPPPQPKRQRVRLDPAERRNRRLTRKAELARLSVLKKNRRRARLQQITDRLRERLGQFESNATGLPQPGSILHLVSTAPDAVNSKDAALAVAALAVSTPPEE